MEQMKKDAFLVQHCVETQNKYCAILLRFFSTDWNASDTKYLFRRPHSAPCFTGLKILQSGT